MNYTNPNDFWNPGEEEMYKNMTDEERFLAVVGHIGCMIVAIFIVMIICAMCSSCTTTQYVPVIEHRTDTVRQCLTLRDSIWVHDSTFIKEKGDTVRIEKWHTKYVSKEVRDTTYISKTDTVPQPYPVVKEVPRERTWLEKTLLGVGGMTILALIIGLVVKLKKYLPGG